MEEIVLVEAAIGLIEKLYPKIEAAVQSGTITVEQQLSLHDRVDALRQRHRWSAPTTGDVGGVTKAPPSNQPAPGTGTAPAPGTQTISGTPA